MWVHALQQNGQGTPSSRLDGTRPSPSPHTPHSAPRPRPRPPPSGTYTRSPGLTPTTPTTTAPPMQALDWWHPPSNADAARVPISLARHGRVWGIQAGMVTRMAEACHGVCVGGWWLSGCQDVQKSALSTTAGAVMGRPPPPTHTPSPPPTHTLRPGPASPLRLVACRVVRTQVQAMMLRLPERRSSELR